MCRGQLQQNFRLTQKMDEKRGAIQFYQKINIMCGPFLREEVHTKEGVIDDGKCKCSNKAIDLLIQKDAVL